MIAEMPLEARPLAGLVVLDFAQFLAGPLAALRLADLGADVTKVERPQGGDLCRGLTVNDQKFCGDSLLFHTFNRGKKSVSADLKNTDDLSRVKAMVAEADVLIHNFRPGVMERIGLGYEAVNALNPRIVYGAVTGYGNVGPLRDKPGQDLLVQALSGLLFHSGNADDPPTPVALPVVDMATGNNLVQGILAALVRRGVTGKGALVEVDLLSSALDLQFEPFTAWLNDNGGLPRRSALSNANVYGAAPYGVFQTADGHLALAMTPIATLAALLDLPALDGFSQAEAYPRRDEIKRFIAAQLKTRTTKDWLAVLEPKGVWCADVLNWDDLIASPFFEVLAPMQTITSPTGERAITTRCPILINGQRLTTQNAAPALDAHTP